jgi:hypothetical protein
MMIRVPKQISAAMKTKTERDAIELSFELYQSFYQARGYSRAAATERAWSRITYESENNFDWSAGQ